MELVIDISEKLYNKMKTYQGLDDTYVAVKNGTPLPKGHGRLKDIDKFLKRVEEDRGHECYMRSWTIDDVLQRLDSWYAPTIIEADKESEDTNEATTLQKE